MTLLGDCASAAWITVGPAAWRDISVFLKFLNFLFSKFSIWAGVALIGVSSSLFRGKIPPVDGRRGLLQGFNVL